MIKYIKPKISVLLIFLCIACGNQPQLSTPPASPLPLITQPLSQVTSTSVNAFLTPSMPSSTIPITFTATLAPTLTNTSEIKIQPSETPTPDSKRAYWDIGWIAYTDWGATSGIGIIRPDGSESKSLIGKFGLYDHPSWSPDGRWITFSSDYASSEREHYQIFTVNKDSGEVKAITSGSGSKNEPAWSPDGNRIAYVNDNNIYVINLLNNEIQQLTATSKTKRYPTWSPDGQKIAYFSSLGSADKYSGSELIIMNADGTKPRKAVDIPMGEAFLTWSSDGKRIAFQPFNGSCEDVSMLDLDTGEIYPFITTPEREDSLTWSPNNQFVSFLYISVTCAEQETITLLGWTIKIADLNGHVLQSIENYDISPQDTTWSPVPSLEKGMIYTITTLGANLNLRSSSSLKGNIIKKLSGGEEISVLEGPEETDGYYWWKIRTSDGVEGWAVDVAGWYKKK